MRTAYSPPPGKGRQRISGAVVANGNEQYCLVKRLVSHAEGLNGSPRVEIWIGLSESAMAPKIFRRGWFSWDTAAEWEITREADHGPFMLTEFEVDLAAIGYQLTDVWPGNPYPAWPTNILDCRVILPDDRRWSLPPTNQRTESIRQLIRRRNICPDEEVWRIDALILAIAIRDKGASL